MASVEGVRAAVLRVRKFGPDVETPEISDELKDSVSYNIFGSALDLGGGCRAYIRTGIAIECPPGFYARMIPAPSYHHTYDVNLHIKHPIIPENFRGEIVVSLVNRGTGTAHFDIMTPLCVIELVSSKQHDVVVVDSFE
jgi:dUTPase